ncbi:MULTISPECIES: M16 family metallopeptidase [unclassified Yoonia]|uniref:M16 family metallopeptidase n=1 Tax=unclassified Yoonia TaxID=2629118 RepID=UPI002AFE9D5A|nr:MULTISPECIES: insulinase family protein [unclassified Yoonia]
MPTATSETSDGGHAYTLITIPDHDYVSIQIAWGTDWPYRNDTNKAAPYIGTELILAGGAEGYSAGEVAELFADFDSEGLIYNAVNDHVIGELTFAPEHITETVEIANAHLRAPTLDPECFDRISTGLAQNMAEAQSQPAHAGFDSARWAVYHDQPLRNALSLDDPDTFTTLIREDVSAWHQETFTSTPEAIVIAGDIAPAEAGAALDTLLSGLPDASRQLARTAEPDFSPRRILLHMPETEVTTLGFIAPVPPTRQGSEMEDLILMHALGGDDQSVLFNAVRTELRATYGFGAGMANYTREHRILAMTGEVETDKLAQAEKVVREAYAEFITEGLQRPLAERKASFEQHFEEMPEYVVDLATSELQSALDGHSVGRSLELTTELAAVTDDSINSRLTAAFPAPETLLVIAVSPDAAAFPGACVITTPREAADCP